MPEVLLVVELTSEQSVSRRSRNNNWSEGQEMGKALVARGASKWEICVVAQKPEIGH